MDEIDRIAHRVFSERGVAFSRARRGGGWTNRTWLAGGLVLRLSPEKGTDRIRREQRLANVLPESVGYPTVVEVGVTEGHEWSLSEEIVGKGLDDVWGGLTWAERKDVMQRLFEIAAAVHRVSLPSVSHIVSDRAWYSSFHPAEGFVDLADLESAKVITRGQRENLAGTLDRFWSRFGSAGRVLNHGDITPENVIRDLDGRLHLLDFEHAVAAPAQLDLYSLLRFGLGPETIGDADDSQADPDLVEFQSFLSGLSAPMLTGREESELLHGFAVLISLRRMKIWMAGEDTSALATRSFERWEPFRCLKSLAGAEGGYLANVCRSQREARR